MSAHIQQVHDREFELQCLNWMITKQVVFGINLLLKKHLIYLVLANAVVIKPYVFKFCVRACVRMYMLSGVRACVCMCVLVISWHETVTCTCFFRICLTNNPGIVDMSSAFFSTKILHLNG